MNCHGMYNTEYVYDRSVNLQDIPVKRKKKKNSKKNYVVNQGCVCFLNRF